MISDFSFLNLIQGGELLCALPFDAENPVPHGKEVIFSNFCSIFVQGGNTLKWGHIKKIKTLHELYLDLMIKIKWSNLDQGRKTKSILLYCDFYHFWSFGHGKFGYLQGNHF